MRFGRKGFTLIELIIVVIIVGILAAIAAPMMSGNLRKARQSEAIAACGTLRTAARCYLAEHQATTPPATLALTDLSSYVVGNDLNGKNYNASDYGVAGSGTIVTAGTGGGGGGWVNLNIVSGDLNSL